MIITILIMIITGHNQLSYTWCTHLQIYLECPSHCAKFKKSFHCVKMLIFFAMVFLLWGGANSSLYVHARFPGEKYNLHHQILMQTVFFGLVVIWWHLPPSCWCISNHYMGRTCLTWLKQQPTQHMYFL